MEHFQDQKTLRGRPEYPQLVKHYNETGVMLMRFELEIQVKKANQEAQPFTIFSGIK
jgi:hypothetical protein